jgi:hypothetical protein
VNQYVHVFAVLRHDLYAGEHSIKDTVTILAVVPTLAEAVREVERLSRVNAGKSCEYFWQSARYYPNGRRATDPDRCSAPGLEPPAGGR